MKCIVVKSLRLFYWCIFSLLGQQNRGTSKVAPDLAGCVEVRVRVTSDGSAFRQHFLCRQTHTRKPRWRKHRTGFRREKMQSVRPRIAAYRRSRSGCRRLCRPHEGRRWRRTGNPRDRPGRCQSAGAVSSDLLVSINFQIIPPDCSIEYRLNILQNVYGWHHDLQVPLHAG